MPENAHIRSAFLALVFTVVVWGMSPAFVRNFSLSFGPWSSLVVRMVLAGLVFALLLAFTTGFHVERRDWPRLALLSFSGLLGYYAFATYGFAHAPAGIGTLITASQPMIIALLAALAGSERLTSRVLFGLGVSFAGTALLVSGNDYGSGVSGNDVLLGCFLLFMAGVMWTIFVVFSRPLIHSYGALKITGLTNIIIALPLVVFLRPEMAERLVSLGPRIWTELAILTLLSATAAVWTWNYAAGVLKPTVVGAGLYVVPVLAVAAGWWLLGESINVRILLSAGIILSGVAISQMGSWRAARA